VIAVAVQAWGRDQCGQALDQLQGRKPQLGAPIGQRLGEVDLPVFAAAEHPVDHAAVEMDMSLGNRV
jgi:hypothetical protein